MKEQYSYGHELLVHMREMSALVRYVIIYDSQEVLEISVAEAYDHDTGLDLTGGEAEWSQLERRCLSAAKAWHAVRMQEAV